MTDPLHQCVLCSPTHCLHCSSISTCIVCDTVNGYFLNTADNLCYLCSGTVPNCLTCSAFGVCQLCDHANNYYLNANNTCSFCNNT